MKRQCARCGCDIDPAMVRQQEVTLDDGFVSVLCWRCVDDLLPRGGEILHHIPLPVKRLWVH